MEKRYAPFTPEEVVSFNDYQQWGGWHPFTCDLCGTTLAAEVQTLFCPHPDCVYRQDWAWHWMFDGSWRRAEALLNDLIARSLDERPPA